METLHLMATMRIKGRFSSLLKVCKEWDVFIRARVNPYTPKLNMQEHTLSRNINLTHIIKQCIQCDIYYGKVFRGGFFFTHNSYFLQVSEHHVLLNAFVQNDCQRYPHKKIFSLLKEDTFLQPRFFYDVAEGTRRPVFT